MLTKKRSMNQLTLIAESSDLQEIFDDLYNRSCKNESFSNLIELVIRQDNIVLAYMNLTKTMRYNTKGIDSKNLDEISQMTCEEVVNKVRSLLGYDDGSSYNPKPIIHRTIEDLDGSMRSLGIPCIWDRFIQQCIRQVLEPICEAKFSQYSFGFRPFKSAENAISSLDGRLQISHATQVIEVNLVNFYNEVNHTKLIRQLWSIGIQDKYILYLIKRMLMTPIKNGQIIRPSKKGIIQTGILAPLLTNVVLNEFDHWIDSQWTNFPLVNRFCHVQKNGARNAGIPYKMMRKTKLKEMYFVRYAHHILVLCKTRSNAIKIKFAVQSWFQTRLKLGSNVIDMHLKNSKRTNILFLGFQTKMIIRRKKFVIKSRVEKFQFYKIKKRLTHQARYISRPRLNRTIHDEILAYNSLVLRFHDYYKFASHICKDCSILIRSIMTVLTNRLGTKDRSGRLLRCGGDSLTAEEKVRFGQSQQIRYEKLTRKVIYPIGYIRYKVAMQSNRQACPYTAHGRSLVYKNTTYDRHIMYILMNQSYGALSIEYVHNKLMKYCDQCGCCWVSGQKFVTTRQIHCHHIISRKFDGDDSPTNLVLVDATVHSMIHSTVAIAKKMCLDYKFTSLQINRLNLLRSHLNLEPVVL